MGRLTKPQAKKRLMEAHDKMLRVWVVGPRVLTTAQRNRLLKAINDIEHIVNGMS
tara:strand:+ start:331 stop:495 length:165 start_codon:yes stop_codon:yes gene_type:complete